jgi:small-conductance mechanosensitive channel
VIEPAQLLLGILSASGIFAFLLGAMVIGGGVASVRRQAPQLVLVAVGLLAIAVLVPALEEISGGVIGGALFAVSLLLIGARIAQRRREPVEAKERRAAAMRSPKLRWLIGSFVVFMVFVAVLAAFLGRTSSQ